MVQLFLLVCFHLGIPILESINTSALLAGLLALISGCQTHPLFDVSSSSELESYGSVTHSDPPESAPYQSIHTPAPTGQLSLADVLSLAELHSPRLAANATDIQIAQAKSRQAKRWANPQLELEMENIAGSGRFSGVNSAETTLSLAQVVPLGGDIALQHELADVRRGQAQWALKVTRLDVLHEATVRYITALVADRQLALAQRELQWSHAIEQLITRRVEAGDASPVEKTRVLVPVVTAEVAVERAHRQRDTASLALASLWGSRQVSFSGLTGALEQLSPLPESDALVRLINTNPSVAQWAEHISEYQAQAQLIKAQAIPDMTGRLGIKHHNEDDQIALVIGISLPLPIFDRREDDVLAARLGMAGARQRQQEAQLRLENMLSQSYSQLADSHDLATALQHRAIPAATEAYQATRQSFNQGKLPFLDVLDTQRTLFELEHRYISALQDYHLAAAQIESLIGSRLIDLPISEKQQENPHEVSDK